MTEPAPLATPAQLGVYLKTTIEDDDPSALLMLDIASGMIRDYVDQMITQVADDVVVLDPVDGEPYVELPEHPVTAITLVELTWDYGATWVTLPRSSYVQSMRLGYVQARSRSGVRWPWQPETWRVTYTHGLTFVPSSLVGVCVGVAGRAYSGMDTLGITAETVGSEAYTYAIQAAGFEPLELIALNRFKERHLA